MSEEIDTEILITLVESRPILWDKTLETYKNKILTKNAWKDVCEALHSTFKDMNDEEKNKFGKEVMKRWSNIRDSYIKSKKKIKDASKSGAGASHLKKYIYNDQLTFLDKVTEERSTEDSLPHENNSSGDQIEESGTPFKKPRYSNRSKTTRNKTDPFEDKILQALNDKPEQENRHISFFKGIVPSLSSFDEDDVIQLQIGVLQLIGNIKKQKSLRTTTDPMTTGMRNYTQHYTSPPPTYRGQYSASQGQQSEYQATSAKHHSLSQEQPYPNPLFPQPVQPTSASQYYSSYGQQCFSPEGILSETSSVSSVDFSNE